MPAQQPQIAEGWIKLTAVGETEPSLILPLRSIKGIEKNGGGNVVITTYHDTREMPVVDTIAAIWTQIATATP